MRRKPQPIRLLRLRGTTWENWEFPQTNEPFKIEKESGQGGYAKSVLGVPARRVIAAPFWVKATDPEIVRSSTTLELDLRGLLSRKRSGDAIVSKAIVEGDRTLVVAAIYPSVLPETLEGQAFQRFEASPNLVNLEEDSATFWKEGQDLVAAFTRGQDLVYWTTSLINSPAEFLSWVKMIVLQLVSHGILKQAPNRYQYDEEIELFVNTSYSESGFVVSPVPLTPSLKHAKFDWKPESAHEADRKSLAAGKARQILGILGSIYLVFVVSAAIFLSLLWLKERNLKTKVASLEKEAGGIEPIIQEWQIIGPSVEQPAYPLEVLHFVVKNLPQSGIRLTTYDMTGRNVVIEGEATSASLASQFFNSVSKESGLMGIHWEMPPPTLLPSSAARFHINGVSQ